MDNLIRFNLDQQTVLDNVAVAQCYSCDHLDDLLKQIRKLASESTYGLVIVDSLMTHHRSDYPRLFELPDRQKRLDAVLKSLKEFAQAYGAAVVYTIDTLANVGGNMFGPSTHAGGGQTVARAADLSLKVKKVSDKKNCYSRFTMTVEKSSMLPTSKAYFKVKAGGVVDD